MKTEGRGPIPPAPPAQFRFAITNNPGRQARRIDSEE
jgi:hypothetical protein